MSTVIGALLQSSPGDFEQCFIARQVFAFMVIMSAIDFDPKSLPRVTKIDEVVQHRVLGIEGSSLITISHAPYLDIVKTGNLLQAFVVLLSRISFSRNRKNPGFRGTCAAKNFHPLYTGYRVPLWGQEAGARTHATDVS
jgi:hypothetical protein